MTSLAALAKASRAVSLRVLLRLAVIVAAAFVGLLFTAFSASAHGQPHGAAGLGQSIAPVTNLLGQTTTQATKDVVAPVTKTVTNIVAPVAPVAAPVAKVAAPVAAPATAPLVATTTSALSDSVAKTVGAVTAAATSTLSATPAKPVVQVVSPILTSTASVVVATTTSVTNAIGAAASPVLGGVDSGVLAPVEVVTNPVTGVLAPIGSVITPVTGVIAPIGGVIDPVTGVIAPIGSVVAPITGGDTGGLTNFPAPGTQPVAPPTATVGGSFVPGVGSLSAATPAATAALTTPATAGFLRTTLRAPQVLITTARATASTGFYGTPGAPALPGSPLLPEALGAAGGTSAGTGSNYFGGSPATTAYGFRLPLPQVSAALAMTTSALLGADDPRPGNRPD